MSSAAGKFTSILITIFLQASRSFAKFISTIGTANDLLDSIVDHETLRIEFGHLASKISDKLRNELKNIADYHLLIPFLVHSPETGSVFHHIFQVKCVVDTIKLLDNPSNKVIGWTELLILDRLLGQYVECTVDFVSEGDGPQDQLEECARRLRLKGFHFQE